jgi:predicted permease
MADEMRHHLDGLTDRHVAAGMAPDEARRAALRQFGAVAQIAEDCRDQRYTQWLDALVRDVRHGCRTLVRAPVLTIVIVISLGAGIGVNTTIFSWMQAMMVHPIPGVRGSSNFYLIETRTETNTYPGLSWLEYRDIREQLRGFQDLLAHRMAPVNIGERGQDERAYALLVSGNYFSVLGLQPALGRFLHPDEVSRPGGAPVVVISHGYWQAHFAGSSSAVGQTLRVNDRILTIVGVAPRDFQGTTVGLNFDLWAPATMAPLLLDGSRELEVRADREYGVIGRLQPGVGSARAQIELDSAMRRLAQDYPESNGGVRAEVRPFWWPSHGPQRGLIAALAVLQGIMLLVLLVVCTNTANLLLAQATARRREMGVRLAIGAGPRRIVAMLLTESLVLALVGAGFGAALAVWGNDALRAMPTYGALPIRFQTGLDMGGLLFAVLLGIGCSVIFGTVPAVHMARTDPQDALRSGAQSAGRSRFRSRLVTVEVALAIVVLVVAAMFVRNFLNTHSTDTGFRREGVLVSAYDLNGRGYDPDSARTITRTLLERLRGLPGVEAAALASTVPLDLHGLPTRTFVLAGRPRNSAGSNRAISYDVTRDYFRVMGIPVVAGSDFVDLADTVHPPQAIVNEEFVRRYLDGGASIGQRLELRSQTFEITGVVANSLYEAFGEPLKPVIYLSYRDRFWLTGQIHLRTRGREGALAADLRQIMRAINPGIQIYDVRTLAEHIDRSLILQRVPARMFSVLGPLILLLAAIGIYAVVAYSVTQRTLEIGVRRALGATERGVIAQIVREGMHSVWAGVLLGWIPAFVVDLHLRSAAVGPGILVGVPALLLAVAAVACWLPAHRAARIDPMVALRRE